MKHQPEKLAYLVTIKPNNPIIKELSKCKEISQQFSKLVMAIDKDHAKNAALILFNNADLTAADLKAKRV